MNVKELSAHKVNGCNEAIKISVLDEPGQGGACHLYRLAYDDPKWGPDPQSMRQMIDLHFQEGPIAEVGINGITHEALLAILIDRLQSFQAGAYACHENALALTTLEEAMYWLHNRTLARVARGVEGTHAK